MGSLPALGHSQQCRWEERAEITPPWLCLSGPPRVKGVCPHSAYGFMESRGLSLGWQALGASPELYLKGYCSSSLFSLFLRGTLLWQDAQTLILSPQNRARPGPRG